MRDIEFRGLFNGRWFYGDLITNPVSAFIDADYIRVEVDPNTVGQFTGIFDIKGKKIYEGDIVSFTRGSGDWKSKDYRIITTIHVVAWDSSRSAFRLKIPNDSMKFRSCQRYEYEVIGNVYNIPEVDGDRE